MEECIGIDQDILNEVIIPTMNVSRIVQGQTDPNEQLNKSQIYVKNCVATSWGVVETLWIAGKP